MQKLYLKQLLVAVLALLCSVAASAYDLEVDGIYYNILSISDLTVEVTYGDKNIVERLLYHQLLVINLKLLQ